MKYSHNIKELAALSPDYMGHIFWKSSARAMDNPPSEVSPDTVITGVFVNASIPQIEKKVNNYNLGAIQLHGDETPLFCRQLKDVFQKTSVIPLLIKVFAVGNTFNFSVLSEYEEVCDFFLFDAKGLLPGGNGHTFNWSLLQKYTLTKPYFLSGGIGPEHIEELKTFFSNPASKYCHALDVNSGFEKSPGLKDIEKLKLFIQAVRQLEQTH